VLTKRLPVTEVYATPIAFRLAGSIILALKVTEHKKQNQLTSTLAWSAVHLI
jgi:hypothetical protein